MNQTQSRQEYRVRGADACLQRSHVLSDLLIAVVLDRAPTLTLQGAINFSNISAPSFFFSFGGRVHADLSKAVCGQRQLAEPEIPFLTYNFQQHPLTFPALLHTPWTMLTTAFCQRYR